MSVTTNFVGGTRLLRIASISHDHIRSVFVIVQQRGTPLVAPLITITGTAASTGLGRGATAILCAVFLVRGAFILLLSGLLLCNHLLNRVHGHRQTAHDERTVYILALLAVLRGFRPAHGRDSQQTPPLQDHPSRTRRRLLLTESSDHAGTSLGRAADRLFSRGCERHDLLARRVALFLHLEWIVLIDELHRLVLPLLGLLAQLRPIIV